MPEKDPDVRLAIEHSIKTLSRWTIILYFAVAAVLGYGILSNRATVNAVEEASVRTDKALCSFVADLERRVETTRKYLDKNEGSEPIPGITRADLRRSINNQRMTLHSLGALDCRGAND